MKKETGRRESTGTESKRKRSDDDHIQFIAKRPRKELDFHLREMEYELKDALKCAKEGNRSMMEIYLRQAKEHAAGAGASVMSDFYRRANDIRGQLKDEKQFHKQEMENALKDALKYAKEGNRSLMEFQLRQAKDHAVGAGTSVMSDFHRRESNIKEQLPDEKQFYKQEMENALKDALKYAKEGGRSLMEFCLRQAKDHAVGAGTSDMSDFHRRESNIREQLQDEEQFYKQEMENALKDALKYAKEGNRSLMEFCLRQAKEHASSSKYNALEQRVFAIKSIFFGAKPEHTCTSRRKNFSTMSTPDPQKKDKSKCIDALNSDELEIQKELTVEQIVSKRVREAESKGEIIHLS